MEVRSVEAIVRALNEAQVRYLIVGGVAVIVYGMKRTAGRPQDLADIADLSRLQELKREFNL